jgi:polyisoprenoid-binding protein YceI
MKKLIYPIGAIVIIMASAFAFVTSQDWKINEDYSIKFEGGDPSGVFRGLKGAVSFDESNLAGSKFDVTVDVATINTGNGMKNTHAKSAKWFDAEKYPTISFISTQITKTASGYEAKGKMQMHGVTKEFVMPFTFVKNDKGGVFHSAFELNRLDYEVNTAEPDHGAALFKIDISVPVSNP